MAEPLSTAAAAAKAAKAAKALRKTGAARGAARMGGGGSGRNDGEPGTLAKLAIFIAAITSVSLIGLVVIAAVLGGVEAECSSATASLDGVDEAGAQPYLEIYADAAAVYKVSPFLLMAVHEDETTYGQSTAPGVKTGVNTAGCCAGPMQFFIGSGASPTEGGRGMTWEGYRNAYRRAKLPRPASYPNRFTLPRHATPNVYDSYDAIYAAAQYFHALGAGPRLDERTRNALISYKGTPPASIPFADHDYKRAKELERRARGRGGGQLASAGRSVASVALSVFGVAATKKARSTAASAGTETLTMPVVGPIVSPYGPRWGRIHEGIDIAAPHGTPIKAAASGIVNYQGTMSGYGNYVCIRHNAKLTTCYAHLSGYGKFSNGNTIARGDVLGYVGCTGHCYGDHLHFETRTGPDPGSPAVDPMSYLGNQVAADGSGGSAASAECAALTGSGANAGGALAWPVNGGKVIQHSNQRGGTHDPGTAPHNWQSDNALDIRVPVGTEVYAAANGTISMSAGFGPTGKAGAQAGIRFTLDVSDNRVFYHHLSRLAPGIAPGKRVRRGQVVGWSGTANNVPHLHVGLERGKPEVLFGLERGATADLDKGDAIAYVGDSLGVGTVPPLRGLRPRLRIDADTRVGRPSAEGATRLDALLRRRHKAVVFDLGTNDGSADALRDSLGRAKRMTGGRPLIVATLNGPGARAKNKAIRSFSARYPTVVVVPWASSDAGLLAGDGFHATPSGYSKRAQLFAEVLR